MDIIKKKKTACATNKKTFFQEGTLIDLLRETKT